MAGQFQRNSPRYRKEEDAGHHNPLTPGGQSQDRLKQASSRAQGSIDNIDDVLNDSGSKAGPSYDGSPGSVLQQERDAARGNVQQQTAGLANPNPSISRGGLGVKNDAATAAANQTNAITRGGFGKTARDELKAKEEGTKLSLFNPDKDKKDKDKKKVPLKKRVTAIIAVATALGSIGSAAWIILTGPGEFIAIAQELAGFHLDLQSDQGDSSAFRIARYILNFQKGTPERSRMGLYGNKVADKIEANFKAAGIESQYSKVFGYQKGVLLDPQKLNTTEFKQLQGKSSAEIVTYFQEKYKVPVSLAGVGTDGHPRFLLEADKLGYFQFNKLNRELMRASGYHWLSTVISGHKMATRGAISFHITDKARNKALKSVEERLLANEEFEKKYAKNGVTAAEVAAAGTVDDKGKANPDTAAAAEATDDLVKEAQDVAAKDAAGDKTALAKWKSSMTLKYSAFGAGVISIICAIFIQGKNADVVNQQKVVEVEKRIGMEKVSVGQELEAGVNTTDTEHLKVIHDRMYSSKNGDWSNACGVRYEEGRPQGGCTDIPGSAKIDDKGNVVSQFLGAIPGLDQLCAATETAFGVIVLTGLSFTPGVGIVKNIVQAVVGAVSMAFVLNLLFDVLTGNQVNLGPETAGPIDGGYSNSGVLLAANDIGLTKGAGPVSTTDAVALRQASDAASKQEFQNQSLAYKMFNPDDSKSFIAQVFKNQSPDRADNLARFTGGFLNIGKNVGSMFSSVLFKPALAAQPYDYSFPKIAWSTADLDDPKFENPFQVTDVDAPNIMDANSAANVADIAGKPNVNNYIARAKVCFGVSIVIDGPNSVGQNIYGIAPPVQGEEPTYKAIQDPANKCSDQNHDWKTVRMFINYSTTMAGLACAKGEAQACVDSGVDADPNAGTATAGAGGFQGAGGPATCTGTPKVPAGYHVTGCDDFEGTALDTAKWSAYNGPGHNGNGRRDPKQVSVNSGIMTITGDANGNSDGMAWTGSPGQKFGYWEARMRVGPAGGGGGEAWHPVLLLWPDSGDWPAGAEYDYQENNVGDDCLGAFLHYPNHQPKVQEGANKCPFDLTAWHTYGFEWLQGTLIGYVDGVEWFRFAGHVSEAPGPMHQTIQLDAFHGTGPYQPAQMQVDWFHQYAK